MLHSPAPVVFQTLPTVLTPALDVRPFGPLALTLSLTQILYSLVTSRAIYFQIFKEGSPHRSRHTFIGWASWIGIVFGGWVISFIIGEAVPFFSDLLSLISSLFDSSVQLYSFAERSLTTSLCRWFGYILWAIAYFQMTKGRRTAGVLATAETVLNVLILLTGFYFFTAGTYASVQSIIDSCAFPFRVLLVPPGQADGLVLDSQITTVPSKRLVSSSGLI